MKTLSLCSLVVLACGSCGEAPQRSSASASYISVEIDQAGLNRQFAYRSDDAGTALEVNGVTFKFLDPAAYVVNFEVLGFTVVSGGAKVTSYEKAGTEPAVELAGAPLTVLDRDVQVLDGVLTWGEESLGAVTEGDVYLVDAKGLRKQDS